MKIIFKFFFIAFLIVGSEGVYCKMGKVHYNHRLKNGSLGWCEAPKCYNQTKKSASGEIYQELGCLTLKEAEEKAKEINASALRVHSMEVHFGRELTICGFNYCNQRGRLDHIPQYFWQHIYNLFDPIV